MKNPRQLDNSRARLTNALDAAQRKRRVPLRRRKLSFEHARAVEGRFDFKEMYEVYRGALRASLPDVPTLVQTDIDEVRNRISVGVARAADTARTRSILSQRGVPSEMLDIGVVHTPELNDLLTDYLRPVPGGAALEVTFVWSPQTVRDCTNSFNLLHYPGQTYEPPASARYLITNSHCTVTWWDSDGAEVFQGGVTVASEYGDPVGFTGSPCQFQKVCRYSDATLLAYHSGSDSDDTRVAFPTTEGSTSFTSHKTITWVDTPYYGMSVHMIGQTSGRQVGNVIYTCIDVYGPGGATDKVLLCQNTALYLSDDGDSGAPVITLYGDGSVSATGQHWGNYSSNSAFYYSYFSAMYMVLGEFYDAFGSMFLSPFEY
jgi:hypothetical protein